MCCVVCCVLCGVPCVFVLDIPVGGPRGGRGKCVGPLSNLHHPPPPQQGPDGAWTGRTDTRHTLDHETALPTQVLLPLLLWAASHHTEAKTRDQLLKEMFELVEKPSRKDREALLCSLVTYARLNGEEQVASELLPHCLEHITDRQLEKRMLVAESCGSLTPHLPVRGGWGGRWQVAGCVLGLSVWVGLFCAG